MINCIGVSTRNIVVIQLTHVYLWLSYAHRVFFPITKVKEEEENERQKIREQPLSHDSTP